MDPVQAAKKLIDSLMDEEIKLSEAYEKEEEENEEEENDEGEEKENSPEPKQSQNGTASNSTSMKPASFSGGGEKGGLVVDAHGGGEQDAHGGGVQLGTMQYAETAAQNQASIAMKPSFSTGGGMTKMSEEQVRQDIMAIFGSSDLSEEFINKAGSLYEAAVLAKAEEVVREVHEQYEAAFEQEVDEVKQELTEKIDSYLNYVVDQWMTENKLAIENGIRTEIAENFIGKLKDLFVESYIEVPQNKTNLFDEMAETISELEEKVNTELQRNVTLVNENKAMKAVGIFMEQTKHLTDVQSDKVAKLAENIEFNSEEDFADKIKTLVENVAKTNKISENKVKNQVNNKYLTEETTVEVEDGNDQQDTINDPFIKLYSDILTRTLQK
jgi:Mn-dependent DtxR family transcriptional regulator